VDWVDAAPVAAGGEAGREVAGQTMIKN
jgi:hypothetical protein